MRDLKDGAHLSLSGNHVNVGEMCQIAQGITGLAAFGNHDWFVEQYISRV